MNIIMNLKYLKSFSYFFSIFFLVVITFLTIFTFTISEKPLKLNFLNLFDRESSILKKYEIKEIGDIFVSFNKKSKKFEFLVENLLIQDFFFPNLLLSLDLSFAKFFNTSLKIYDGQIKYTFKKESSSDPHEFKVKQYFESFVDLNILNKFSELEIINNKITIINKNNSKFKYTLDLNYKKNEIFGALSERDNVENQLSFLILSKEEFFTKIRANNFDMNLLEPFLENDLISFGDLKISGYTEVSGRNIDVVDSFNFDFSLNGDISYLTNFKSKKILFKNNPLIGSFNENKIDISFTFLENKSNFKLGLKKQTNESFLFYLGIDTIEIEKLLRVWPKNLANSTFNWMNQNSDGIIEDVIINLETEYSNNEFFMKNVKGTFDCKNIEISYMDSMPSIKNINGYAEMFNDKVIFYVNSGESNNLLLTNGQVNLYDLDTDVEKADISLNIVSKNFDIVEYLKLTTIEKKSYSKLEKISGDVNLNLTLKFPLLVDLSVDQIKYGAKAKINEGTLNNLYKNYSINDLSLEINVNEDLIDFNGEGQIGKSSLLFNGEQKTVEKKIIDKISGSLILDSSSVQSTFSEIIQKSSGSINIDFRIDNSEDKLKIDGIGYTNNFNSESEFFGPNLDFKGGKLRFIITPYDDKYSGFFDLQTSNIDIEINTVFVDSGLISAKINKLKVPKQDFEMEYNSKNSEIRVYGNKISLPKLDIQKDSQSFLDFANLDLSLEVSKLLIHDNQFFESIIEFKKKNDEFIYLDVELKGENYYHTIGIYDEFNKRKFLLESNYAPGLLDIIGVNIDLHRGSLRVEGDKPIGSNLYKGKVAGNDLVFLEAPLFADFISLFSLKGLAQKLKDGGIIFEDFNSRYEFSNSKLRLIDSLIKGSELGLSFDTVVGLNDDYFLTTGTIIPAYTLNTLITNFPIVGDIISAGEPEEGLLGANFKIEKKDGDYDMSYNPISVFVPNLLKNFLTD